MRVWRTSALRESGHKTDLTPNLLQTAAVDAGREKLEFRQAFPVVLPRAASDIDRILPFKPVYVRKDP